MKSGTYKLLPALHRARAPLVRRLPGFEHIEAKAVVENGFPDSSQAFRDRLGKSSVPQSLRRVSERLCHALEDEELETRRLFRRRSRLDRIARLGAGRHGGSRAVPALLRGFTDIASLIRENGWTTERKDFYRRIHIPNIAFSFPEERDAFHEFSVRGARDRSGSWSTLMEMRHYGVPTRLLDWTDSFIVAIWFALGDFLNVLVPEWKSGSSLSPEWLPEWPGEKIDNLREPAVFLMNPFHLAARSGIAAAIPHVDFDLPDYYESFLEKFDWPYRLPVPVHGSAVLPRIEAQRGHFTVHGFDPRPLEELVSRRDRILRKVTIPREAAVYGAFFLWHYVNLDAFDLFRDLDSLGRVVRSRHFGP